MSLRLYLKRCLCSKRSSYSWQMEFVFVLPRTLCIVGQYAEGRIQGVEDWKCTHSCRSNYHSALQSKSQIPVAIAAMATQM